MDDTLGGRKSGLNYGSAILGGKLQLAEVSWSRNGPSSRARTAMSPPLIQAPCFEEGPLEAVA